MKIFDRSKLRLIHISIQRVKMLTDEKKLKFDIVTRSNLELYQHNHWKFFAPLRTEIIIYFAGKSALKFLRRYIAHFITKCQLTSTSQHFCFHEKINSRLKLSFLQKPDIFNAIVRLKSPEFIANEQKEASLWVSSLRQEKFEVAIKILQFSLETEITFAQKNNFAGIY